MKQKWTPFEPQIKIFYNSATKIGQLSDFDVLRKST